MKKGYILIRINVKDIDKFKNYPPVSEKVISEYGGKYKFRGGLKENLEGEWPFERNTLIEFESFKRAKEWYFSENYQKTLKIRLEACESEAILIEGI